MFRRNPKIDVLCIGSASLDLFFPTDEGVIIDTPQDILSKKKFAFELGGKILADEIYDDVGGVAANVAQGLALQDFKAACYSCLGDDQYGAFCIQELKKHRVRTDFLDILAHTQTDISAIVVHIPTGDRTIFHNRNANKHLALEKPKLSGAEWVLVSSLNGHWKANLAIVMKAHAEYGFKLAFNPGQHNIHEDPALIFQIIRRTEILFLNKDEATELALFKQKTREHLENEEHLLRVLHSYGPKVVTITDGQRGAWSFDGKELWHQETEPGIKVLDATGAGDAFTSGFLGAVMSGKSYPEALSYGVLNGSSVVQFYGCSAGILTGQELAKRAAAAKPRKLR